MEKKQEETRFKMIIFFIQKPDNSYYSLQEIKLKKHRKYIGSFDFSRGKQKQWVKNENIAFNKQVKELESKLRGRYKTAFIVINDYKGYTIVLRKYVDFILNFVMPVKFFESNQKTGETIIYNIPDANNLIDLYEKGLLNEKQKELIKKVDAAIPVALPYITKQIKNKVA